MNTQIFLIILCGYWYYASATKLPRHSWIFEKAPASCHACLDWRSLEFQTWIFELNAESSVTVPCSRQLVISAEYGHNPWKSRSPVIPGHRLETQGGHYFTLFRVLRTSKPSMHSVLRYIKFYAADVRSIAADFRTPCLLLTCLKH